MSVRMNTRAELGGGAVQTTDVVLEDFENMFDSVGMENDLTKLNEITASFREEVSKVEDSVTSTIGADGDGFKGEYALKIYDLYDCLLGSFNGFSEYCDTINDAGIVVFSTNSEFATDSSNTYNSLLNQPPEGAKSPSGKKNRYNKVFAEVAELK